VYVFAGPTASLTTNATQHITASGSAALGTSTGTATFRLNICTQPSGGGALSALDSTAGTYEVVTAGTTRINFAMSETGVPGAGTWLVGMCVRNTSSQTLDLNDWSVGWGFVTN
jgi:hypothetical protein